MVDFIVDKFNEIVYRACERYAKEENVETAAIQVLFSIDEDGEVKYEIAKSYKPIRQVTFNEILNVRIDFRGYGMLVPQFIGQTINGFAEEMKTRPQELFVMAVPKTVKDVSLFLYEGKTYKQEIKLAEL
jgi:hypothetical protein